MCTLIIHFIIHQVKPDKSLLRTLKQLLLNRIAVCETINSTIKLICNLNIIGYHSEESDATVNLVYK